LTGIYSMPNATALHQDDRMMAVFAKWRGRQPEHITRASRAEPLLETERAKVMAFIDNDLAISAHGVVHSPLAVQTLKNRNINRASRLAAPCADLSDTFQREVQENRKTLSPLIEKLPPMHQNQ